MNNLTIKMKLIISFIVIAILTVILALYSVTGTKKSADGFTDYREMARDSVLAGRVQANMLMVRMNVKDYLNTVSQKDINEFNSYFDKTEGFIKTALKEIQNPNRAPLVKELDEKLKEYKVNFEKVIAYMNERNSIVSNNLDVNGKKIEQTLTSIMLDAEKNGEIKKSLETAHAVRVLLLARLYTTKFLLTNTKEASNRVQKEFDSLTEELGHLTKDITDKNEKESLTEAISLVQTYKNGVAKVENIINERNNIIENKLDVIGPHIANLSEDVKLSIKNDQDIIGPMVANQNSNLITTSITVSIVILVIILLLAIFIPSYISKSIERLNDAILNLLRSKDVSSRIEVKTNDEIGKVSTNFNEYLQSIEDGLKEDAILIEEVKYVVEKVNDGIMLQKLEKSTSNQSLNELKDLLNNMLQILTTNISDNTNKINEALEHYQKLDFTHRIKCNGKTSKGLNALAEIINEMLVDNKANGLTLQNSATILLSNVDTLSRTSNEAAASLEETAAALEEITSTIVSNTNNIVKMSNNAKELTASAKSGEDLANQTTTAMNEIDEEVNAINDAIIVIDQIAFQTNILSLNAAVEAATAGEAGKGFAVVAQEVRNLASRSAEAAKEIKEIVENATLKANKGKEIADKMIHGYQSLNHNIEATIVLIKDVEMASREQQHGIEQINTAISQLDQQTQENANIATQTQEVASTTNHIASTVVKNADEKEFIGKNEVKAKKID